MAFASRSSVFAFSMEGNEGVPVGPAATDFTVVREGAQLTGAVNTVNSDELRNSIGASKSFVTSQAPTGSIPHYWKHSGIEGVEPDYGILIQACLGGVEVNTTEFFTVPGSTAGDTETRATLLVAVGDELNFQLGQGILIKDGANGYAVRNLVEGSSPGVLPMSFNFETAPGGAIGLGKAIHYLPDTDQPTFTAHWYQAAVNSAFHQMISGCRTTGMTIELNANELAAISFEIAGVRFFINPIEITLATSWIDFTDSVGTVAAQLEQKVYSTPIDLANEIAGKMSGVSADVISVHYDNNTGKFIISSDGTVLDILWATGSHAPTSARGKLGFDNLDDTGALTYTSDSAQVYDPPVTPVFDAQTPGVVRDNMLQLGTFSDYLCVGGQALTISVATPKTDVPNWCAETGIDESVILSREVTVSGTLKFKKHDVQRFYNLINNVDTQLSFVHGQKVGGNWVPGSICNVFIRTASMTSETIADQDGYVVEQFEATAYVGPDMEDFYMNFL